MLKVSTRIPLVDIIHFAFEALTDRKLRSGLTILMVLVGAGLVTSLNGMTTGIYSFVNAQLSTLAPNVVIVLPSARPFQQSGGPPPPPTITFTETTVMQMRGIQHVRDAIPLYRGSIVITSLGKSQRTNLIGMDQSKLPLVNPDITFREGEFIGRTDGIGIVLGFNVAFPPGQSNPFVDKIGRLVTVEYSTLDSKTQRPVTYKRTFQVKGIMNQIGSEFRDNSVYVSLPAANAFMQKGGKYDGMYLLTLDAEYNDAVEKYILSYWGENNIGVISPKSIAERIQSIVGGLSAFMSAVAMVSLLVGAMGIVTTLYTAVMERTREIGVLKALGFTNKLVLFSFLCESAVIGIIGATMGLMIGSAGASFVVRRLPLQMFQGRNISAALSFQDLATTWLISVGLSLVAGLYPAWRASKLDPVVAFRRE